MRGCSILLLALLPVGCTPGGCSNSGSGSSGTDQDSSVVDDTDNGGGDTTSGGDTTTSTDTGSSGTDTAVTPDVPPGACTDDMQCPAGQYCVYPGGSCKALGAGKCSGSSPASCGGAGPACKDGACFWSGVCTADSTCHAGEACTTKGSKTLCFPTSPCKEMVKTADVMNGVYSPGKEVCIRDVVHDVISEPDGDFHIRMGLSTTAVFGTCPYPVVPPGKGLVTELTPDYQAAGLTPPAAGATVTIQGTVRWDGYHCWWEIHPVKYIGP